MNTEINIRKADRADLPSVIALYAHIDSNADTLTIEKANDIFSKFGTYPDYSLYVALVDGRIVGTFELLIMDNLAHKGEPSGVVEDVVVDSEMRSKGIGKAMMEYAMNECRRRGCYKLTLSSRIDRVRAHHFYENLGFQKHGFSFIVELINK